MSDELSAGFAADIGARVPRYQRDKHVLQRQRLRTPTRRQFGCHRRRVAKLQHQLTLAAYKMIKNMNMEK